MIFGAIIGLGLFYGLNLLIWGFDINQLSIITLTTDPEVVWATKFLQMFSQVGLFLIPAFLFGYMSSNNPFKEWGLNQSPTIVSFGWVFLITLFTIPFANTLAIWNAELHLPDFLGFVEEWMREMQAKNDLLMEVILQMNSNKDILINLFMMVIIPAVGEELIFRGIIQKQLSRSIRNPHLAIFISAAIFSAFHMQFLGFFSRLVLGMIFGYFYYYSKNIWTAIWAHFVNNGMALTLAIIYGTSIQDADPMMDNGTDPVFIGFSSILFILGFGILLWKREKLFSYKTATPRP